MRPGPNDECWRRLRYLSGEELVEGARVVDQCPEFLDLAVLVEMEDLGPELLEPAIILLISVGVCGLIYTVIGALMSVNDLFV